ncbi:MAG: ABC transporter permease [Betaproteobacteria bacterium]
MSAGAIGPIVVLTLREARRRRLVLAGALLGLAFVLLYALALWLLLSRAPCGPAARPCRTPFERAQLTTALNMLSLAGLYAANFLTVMAAVLLPIDTLSGEIDSGVVQTLASKPIARAEILFGKWLGHWLLVAGYLLLTAGGIVAAAWTVSRTVTGGPGFLVPGAAAGVALMLLEATVMLSISIAGGTRFSTITNGMVAFGLFGLAFLGGWIEQIGEVFVQTAAGRTIVRDLGTVISLIVPADAIWRLAASHMLPRVARDLGLTPFTPRFPPTHAMAVWGAAYAAAILLLAYRQFNARAL